ncbi:MAG: hypothetical protein MR285_04420 [Peptoniphilus sp.]|uniref:hypothetical protein n=1 Tax=Peptoniphilus sp. TaxID=1971214 RepID=UPI0025F4B19A|nr:hypothetical protein [Peptoniphilus sp.]MCI5643338.1 hypothetical protein [Peptoniphilus sp.]MDY3902975.1 hypothetical protein [Peptoniphilus sp.]
MVINLIREDIKNLLDKNAILMCIMAIFFTFISYFLGDINEGTSIANFMKIEGFLILYIVFFIELAKSTLIGDKISKKIEFILANGLTRKELIVKYMISIMIATFVILAPSIILILLKIKISAPIIVNLFFSIIFESAIVVMMILYTININKLNGLQIKLILSMMVIMGICFLLYYFTNMIELYLALKITIFTIILIFLSIKTNKERIVISYY